VGRFEIVKACVVDVMPIALARDYFHLTLSAIAAECLLHSTYERAFSISALPF
jgi:hypothetical protein